MERFKTHFVMIAKITFCAILSFIVHTETYSQNIDGVYINKEGDKRIIIKDGTFYYELLDFRPLHNVSAIPCATCSLKKEKGGFFSINSVDNPMSIFIDNMNVSAELDSLNDNSLMIIRVRVPSYHNRFNLEVITAFRHYFINDYYSNEIIKISKEDISNISIRIYNPYDFNIYDLDLYDADFVGTIPYYITNEIPIEKNTKELMITFSDISEDSFARNYIRGEYFKVENKKIYWRGDIYDKKE
ncbi:MAG: hypothetical protein IKX22_00960 [Prevotella sp.]|nr:hypothetical protein [Prevotella sp.]